MVPDGSPGSETAGIRQTFPGARSMKSGDWILRKRNSTGLISAIGSFFSTLAVEGIMLSFLALIILSTVIAAADICRAVAGNYSLFNSLDFISQYHSAYKFDPLVVEERYRQERSDLDAYRNEKQRWHQLKAEAKERLTSARSKKSAKPHSTL
jgi:hypothetical protein